MIHLYDLIKSKCELKNHSFKWLAEEIGYTRQGLKAALSNDTLKVATLVKIANVFELPVVELFGKIDDNQKIIIQELREEIVSKDKEISIKEKIIAKKEKKYISLLKETNEANKKLIKLFEKKEIYEKGADLIDYDLDLNDIDALLNDLKKARDDKNVQEFNKLIKEIKNSLKQRRSKNL